MATHQIDDQGIEFIEIAAVLMERGRIISALIKEDFPIDQETLGKIIMGESLD